MARVSGAIAESTGDLLYGLLHSREIVRENRRLEAKLAASSLYTEQSNRLEKEIDSLRAMLSMPVRPGKEKVSVDILGYSPKDRRITLTAGSSKGIRANMPVLAANGLLATVQTVSASRCEAVLLTSRSKDRKIGAIVLNRNPTPMGLLGGTDAGTLVLEFQDQSSPVQVGDTIATAGVSDYIPRGIPIGKVIQVEDDPTYGVRRAIVDPFATIGEAREVLILR